MLIIPIQRYIRQVLETNIIKYNIKHINTYINNLNHLI